MLRADNIGAEVLGYTFLIGFGVYAGGIAVRWWK